MDEMTNNTVPAEAVAEAKPEPAKTEPVKDDKAVNSEIEKLKAALTKASADAAEWKRQLREKQSAAEREAAERAEQEKSMREELETLRHERSVDDGKTRSLSIGIDEENAATIADATATLTKEQKDSLFDALKAFVEATKTKANNEALNRQPGLSSGIPPTTNTTTDADMDNMRRWMGVPVHR